MTVSLGDTITVLSADIDAAKTTPINVQWSQHLQTKSENYVKATFTIVATSDPAGKTGPDTAGVIFIQLNMLPQFQAKQVDGKDQFTVVVDQDFQYGQKSKDGTGRWLAFHDKNHKIFQHRFIQGLIAQGGNQLGNAAKEMGYDSAQSLIGAVGGFVGDYLHNFS